MVIIATWKISSRESSDTANSASKAVATSTFAEFDHAKNKPGETCLLAVVSMAGAWLRCSDCVRMDAQWLCVHRRDTQGTRFCPVRASSHLAPGLLQRPKGVTGREARNPADHTVEARCTQTELLAAETADEEIANVLDISDGSVNSCLAYLFDKLGVAGRSEVVISATRRGLVRVSECEEHC